MFSKHFKISNSHSIANKDRKKIKDILLDYKYDPACVTAFLDDKQFEGEELITDKLQGSKVTLLSRNKTPLMFSTFYLTGIIYKV